MAGSVDFANETPQAEACATKNPMFSLKDRVALVTGASQGIGRATALALAQAGARVAAAARNAEKLAGVVAEIAAAGGASQAR